MKSYDLKRIINRVTQKDELLSALKNAAFDIRDRTDEGDSVLHVLAQSNHQNQPHFKEFASTLIHAGADPKAINSSKQTYLELFLADDQNAQNLNLSNNQVVSYRSSKKTPLIASINLLVPHSTNQENPEFLLANMLIQNNKLLKDHIFINPEKADLISRIKLGDYPVDETKLIEYIKCLTPDNSPQQHQALDLVKLINFELDSLDESVLQFEEAALVSKFSLLEATSMLGHLFSLEGFIPVNSSKMKLTGSSGHRTFPFMCHLMNAFVSYYEQHGTHKEHIEAIKKVRNMSVKAMRYYFIAHDSLFYIPFQAQFKTRFLKSMLNDSLHDGVEMLTGWLEHDLDIIIRNKSLYRSNGGECTTDSPIEHYSIRSNQGVTEETINRLMSPLRVSQSKVFIQEDIHQILNLKFEGPIPGTFQTVSNCSFENQKLALKVKYRLFLSEKIADEVYAETLSFFRAFYLKEFLDLYGKNPLLPHLIMRLIIQSLLPKSDFKLIKILLSTYFKTAEHHEILHIELMRVMWEFKIKKAEQESISLLLAEMGIDFNLELNERIAIFNRVLDDCIRAEDIEIIKTWRADKLNFQGNSLLYFAVANNNLELTKQLLQITPAALHQSNWFDEQVMHKVQSVEMLMLLIDAGAVFKNSGVLEAAIKKDNLPLVLKLLHLGAPQSRETVFIAAKFSTEIVRALADYKQDSFFIPSYTDHGNGLHTAAYNGRAKNLRVLIYHGLDPSHVTVNGHTPLHFALKNDQLLSAKKLLKFPHAFFKTSYRGDTEESLAQSPQARALLSKHKAKKELCRKQFTLFLQKSDDSLFDGDYLIKAIRQNDLHSVFGFFEFYPKVNVCGTMNSAHEAPLVCAIKNLAGRSAEDYEIAFKIIKLLLRTPWIDLNLKSSDDKPFLFYAVETNDLRVLELFLRDPELNVDVRDGTGQTALELAVSLGYHGVVKALNGVKDCNLVGPRPNLQ